MANIWGIAIAVFLVVHASVGMLMFAGRPKDAASSWPSSKSWLLGGMGFSDNSQRKVAIVLMAIATLLLVGGALGIVGVPVIVDVWTWLVVAGAFVSALTLLLFFSPWWLGGIGINAVLILLIVVFDWPNNKVLGI